MCWPLNQQSATHLEVKVHCEVVDAHQVRCPAPVVEALLAAGRLDGCTFQLGGPISVQAGLPGLLLLGLVRLGLGLGLGLGG